MSQCKINPFETEPCHHASCQEADSLKCAKCGYEWTPRKPAEQIKECPNCKSRKWRKEEAL